NEQSEGVVLGVTPDRWYWTLDGSGEFSVSSALCAGSEEDCRCVF
ncbi:hypothetical protein Tco_0638807, partial [Tanacetum coccineum]